MFVRKHDIIWGTKKVKYMCVSSMIHSTGPTFLPVVICLNFVLFCEILKTGDGRTDNGAKMTVGRPRGSKTISICATYASTVIWYYCLIVFQVYAGLGRYDRYFVISDKIIKILQNFFQRWPLITYYSVSDLNHSPFTALNHMKWYETFAKYKFKKSSEFKVIHQARRLS